MSLDVHFIIGMVQIGDVRKLAITLVGMILTHIAQASIVMLSVNTIRDDNTLCL